MEERKRGAAPVEGEEMPEPRVDALVDEIKKLQLGRTMIEEKINSVKSLYDSLTRQHDALQIKASQLDELYNLKQEMCHKLHFQCKEFEQESIKLVEENRRVMELLRQYRCEIQEVKLKHRKQRMIFENHLQQLLELHKKLYTFFYPKRLPAEIERARIAKQQLLSAEEHKLDQLRRLEEVWEKANQQD
ncbi:synaptonemal complex central element protein 1 isoform 1-T3 [Synchiropus picturatus]